MRKKYEMIWLAFVHIKPQKGYKFNDLIDLGEQSTKEVFLGAWANILVKAKTIKEAIDIIPLGLAELKFEVVFIDKVENFSSLIDDNILDDGTIKESEWLIKSKYIFKISGTIFPYSES